MDQSEPSPYNPFLATVPRLAANGGDPDACPENGEFGTFVFDPDTPMPYETHQAPPPFTVGPIRFAGTGGRGFTRRITPTSEIGSNECW
jgi:hypothetical protein